MWIVLMLALPSFNVLFFLRYCLQSAFILNVDYLLEAIIHSVSSVCRSVFHG